MSVQLGASNPFGKIPVDQIIEETINKDTQTPGGTRGFSLKPGAVQKYYIYSEHRSLFLRRLREMVGLAGSQFNHPDLQQTRKLRDETAVQSLVNLMEARWINPFRVGQDTLVHLATAAVAPADVVHDLMNTRKIGEDVYQTFKSDHIENPGNIDFFATMKKQRLKTFADTYTKKVNVQGKGSSAKDG